MRPYLLYPLAAALAFAAGVFVAGNFNLKTEEIPVIVQNQEETRSIEPAVQNQPEINCEIRPLPVSPAKKSRDINFRINGVGFGTSYSTVIKKLGKPQRTKTEKIKASESCSNSAETYLTLFYPGLEITLLGYGRKPHLNITSVELTSPNWKASGVSIGSDIKDVLNKFGEPVLRSADEAFFYYFNSVNLGRVNFNFENNKLVSVSMSETLC